MVLPFRVEYLSPYLVASGLGLVPPCTFDFCINCSVECPPLLVWCQEGHPVSRRKKAVLVLFIVSVYEDLS